MEQIILSQNIVNGRNILSPSALTTNDAIYIVRDDFEIVEPINLPLGCELRIEGGSIKASKLNENDPVRGKIYMTPQPPTNSSRNIEYYARLTIASTAKESVSDNTISYTPNEGVFLADGCVLKSTTDYHFEIFVNTPCRVMLPELKDNRRGTLHINSDKVNSIQIDGKCDFQIHAENCKFQRIFACEWGWSTANRLAHNIDHSIFENCEIWAKDYPLPLSTIPRNNSNFLSLSAGVIKDNFNGVENYHASSEVLNWLILRDSVISNLGINGNINANNCTFLFGRNCNDNYETIHCGSHSRITNCLFDGRQKSGQVVPNLTADVIDVYNGHDIIIDGCTFIGYQATGTAGRNMITVKSHYFDPVISGPSDPNYNNNTSDVIGVQNGSIIRNCYFDLPGYIGDIIEVWNGVHGNIVEHRELNRQFTLVEANYVYAPKANNFVNCFGFTDYLTVRNNVGQVEYLVMVNGNYPAAGGDGKNITHNLKIEGNILRVQYYKDKNATDKDQEKEDEKNAGLGIIYGTQIDNIELLNNQVDGYLWCGLNNTTVQKLSGTVRICGNETVGPRGLFKDYEEGATIMPSSLNVFFSENISRGKKTDVGTLATANSQADGIKFVGRQFFCTEAPYKDKLLIFNGQEWVSK